MIDFMNSSISNYPWLTILSIILISLLSLRLLLSYVFSIVFPSLSIGSIRLNSLGNITWKPSLKKKTGLDLFGLKVSIKKVGWSGIGSKNCGTGWLVLKVQGLKIFVPKSLLLQKSRARSSSSASNSSDRSNSSFIISTIPSTLSNLLHSLPNSIRIPLSRLIRSFRKRVVHPGLILFSTICTKLTAFLSLLALEIDLTIEVEDVLIINGILTAGIEVIRGEETRIGGWVGLERLKVSEPKKEGLKDVILSALWMKERMVVKGSAPLDATTGIGGLLSSKGGCFSAGKASILAEISFTEGKEGVHLRVYEIKRILGSIQDILLARKKIRLPIEKDENDLISEGENLFFYLKSISLNLPKFIISAHYDTPIHILAISPHRPLPQSVGFVLTVHGIEGKITMGGMTDGEGIKKDHAIWFGKSRELGVTAKFGWKEIEGRINIDGSEEDILPDSAKAFTIGSSTLLVTSTWLPPSIASNNIISLIDEDPLNFNRETKDFNDDTVVVEGILGAVRGHATFETLDSAVRIFNARPRSQKRNFFSESTTDESKYINGFPRLIGTISAEGLEIRIQAPSIPETPRIDNQHFNRSWISPDVFCISFPNGSLSFGGEYKDRSIKRNDTDRRNAKRLSRKLAAEEDQNIPDRQSIYEAWAPTQELVNDLGVPPPVPLHSHPRTHQIKKPVNSIDNQLDLYSLEYSMRFNLTTDLLNIFILATNDGSLNPEDATSWLDAKPILPSDPIRLDIFTLGPVELSSWHTLLGSESIPPLSIASLDTAAHSGEINVLIENIGIDLWRPPVMGSLKDILSSFVSASEPSSLRTPSTYPPPTPPRSIIELLPLELALYLSIASIDFRIAGSDPINDSQNCKGVAGHARSIIFDYILQDTLRPGVLRYPHRQSLDLREDIRVEANANLAENPGIKQALFKITASSVTLDPVVNARASRGHSAKKPSLDDEMGKEDDWELRNRAQIIDLAKRRKSILPSRMREASKGILNIPEIAFRMKVLGSKKGEVLRDEFIISLETETATARISLFNIYVSLVAISSIRSLIPHSPLLPSFDKERIPLPSIPKRPKPIINLRAEVTDLHVYIDLPTDVKLFLHIRRLRLQHSIIFGVIAEWDMCLLAGESPTAAPKWEDLLRLRVTTITARPSEEGSNFSITIASDTARLRIPFRYVIARIIDNGVNLAKVTKQLIHQHINGKFDFVLEPQEEEAKKLPQIEIDLKMFAIEIQDDPFETKLNIIWRAGYEEQIARLERQSAFDEKVAAIRKMEDEGGNESDEDSGIFPSRQTKFTGKHSIGIEEAKYDLKAYNSSHWVKRMRNAIAEQGRREEALTRRLYGVRHISERPNSLLPVELLPTSRSAPLARATFHGLRFIISKHSYPPSKLPNFLHEVGKGLPLDTKFTLLVPFHLSWKMDEVRFQVRDYPLPLLHIPPISGDVDEEESSWECESDFVIAEEIGGHESVRRVPVVIVPAQSNSGRPIYSLVVPRSAMTVKTYATPIIRINSTEATRIGWGNSIAPALQDVARVIDSLSKPSPDPSERLGFWDKIRLQLHWQVKVLFESEAPLHFHLKGTRDPYSLMGFGAGFSKSWRGNVKILIGLPNPDQEFMQVESDEYILGIPNLRDYVDNAASGLARDPANDNDDRSTQHSSGYGNGNSRNHRLRLETDFVKVCAKFINGVRWGMGAVLERTCPSDCTLENCMNQNSFHRQCRFFEFTPHWNVITKTPETGLGPDGKLISDSFAKFRSDFIHFSISLTSPLSLASTTPDSASDSSNLNDTGYNSVHFSPQASTHFWAWWKLFDGTMSLPIRQGRLFPSAQPPTKKFGKHCATIKYRFSLAPLFMSHTYKQETWEEWANGETSLVGLKGKVARFKVDLHQREQEEVIRRPNSTESKTILHKSFYRAYVDCEGVDLRVISACFDEPEKRETIPHNVEIEFEDLSLPTKDHSIADDELDWVDLDDFVDAVYTIPDRNPRLRVLPFLVCPRFTYRRQTDGKGNLFGENETTEEEVGLSATSGPKSKFGKEPSHTCLMGSAEETISVQIDCAKKRLAELMEEAKSNSKETKDGPKSEIRLRVASIMKIIQRMEQVRSKLRAEAESVGAKPNGKSPTTPNFDHEDDGDDNHLPYIATRFYEEGGEWENRYMIHNSNFQITNATRDVLLKYYYSSRERKGFVYHLSASAIKFIRDLSKEHEKKHRRQSSRKRSTPGKDPMRKNTVLEDSQETNRLLDELVNGGGESFWANSETDSDKNRPFADALDVDPDSLADSLPDAFEQQSGHLVLFIKPQIALQSDVDDKSIIILTAFRAELKAYSIIDSRTPDDPVNAHVLNSTFGRLQGLQAFYPREGARGNQNLFVPLETLIDLRIEPWGFDRVVPRTTARLRYDKFNQLRMSSKGQSETELDGMKLHTNHFQTGTDRVSVEFEKFSSSANPDHFAAIYNVVTDLLLYSDPLQKSRNKKLEELVFTRDFSDLGSAIDGVSSIQERIRSLHQLSQQYQLHLDELDEDGRIELFYGRAEIFRLSNELNLIIQAITRAQDFNGIKRSSSKSAGVQFEARASEIVWHMLDKADIPFAKFSVNGVEFSWISKKDSSISNRLIIKDLKALNSSPDQIFAEIIAKSEKDSSHELCKVDIFAAILWDALAPVGGISIVEQFQIHLHPIRLQLEHSVGRQILNYVFSQRRKPSDSEVTQEIIKPSRPSLAPSSSASSYNRSTDSLPISKNSSRSHLIDNRSSLALTSSSASFSALGRTTSITEAWIADPKLEEGLDSIEMRARAALNRTFLLVEFTPTTLYLTYRSEKEDHSRLPDVYNIVYTTPSVQYRGKTWSFLDLLDELKRDVIKSVWSQKGALLGQLLQTAHRRLPLHEARSEIKKSLFRNRLGLGLKSKNQDSNSNGSSNLRSVSSSSTASLPNLPSVTLTPDRQDNSTSEIELPGISLPFFDYENGRISEEPGEFSSANGSSLDLDRDSKSASIPSMKDRISNAPKGRAFSLPSKIAATEAAAVSITSNGSISNQSDASKMNLLWGKS